MARQSARTRTVSPAKTSSAEPGRATAGPGYARESDARVNPGFGHQFQQVQVSAGAEAHAPADVVHRSFLDDIDLGGALGGLGGGLHADPATLAGLASPLAPIMSGLAPHAGAIASGLTGTASGITGALSGGVAEAGEALGGMLPGLPNLSDLDLRM